MNFSPNASNTPCRMANTKNPINEAIVRISNFLDFRQRCTNASAMAKVPRTSNRNPGRLSAIPTMSARMAKIAQSAKKMREIFKSLFSPNNFEVIPTGYLPMSTARIYPALLITSMYVGNSALPMPGLPLFH